MKSILKTSRLLNQSGRLLSTAAEGKPAPVDRHATFYHRDLEITPATEAELQPRPGPNEPLVFGHTYSDHMINIDWTEEGGWKNPQLYALQDMRLHPGAKVLHYAVELFEGMKAYRGMDNRIRLFRPELNMARMRRTAARCTLPDFDSSELIKCIREMVRLDKEWVPSSTTSSLYLRPTMIGTDSTLGVGHPRSAKLFVLSGPVGQYYSTGFQPVTLLADSEFIRAFPGGVGQYKMGCNYAPTIWVSKAAADKGCQQVLWLHGESEELTEVGTMNIFVLWKSEQGELELVTPPLDKGVILPGVTRQSLLELARQWGEFKVSERAVTMEDVRESIKAGRMLEMFGAGTACVVSPVGSILYHNRKTNEYENLQIPTMSSPVNLMQRFYTTINDIQYGRLEQPGWTVEV